MNYYIDTEFLEGSQDKRILGIKYGETKPTIDLISIGIVSEDGREYYAISKDFNLKEAWDIYNLISVKYIDNGALEAHIDRVEEREYWIRENVLRPIFIELWEQDKDAELNQVDFDNGIFNFNHLKHLISKYGKTNKQIAKEVKEFVGMDYIDGNNEEFTAKVKCDNHYIKSNPKFYGYYADYDWVVFCWIFGKMMDLPNGFPMYCRDLKQELDDKQKYWFDLGEEGRTDKRLPVFSDVHVDIKCLSNYPKQTNEHNALADAKWNLELHKFINKL